MPKTSPGNISPPPGGPWESPGPSGERDARRRTPAATPRRAQTVEGGATQDLAGLPRAFTPLAREAIGPTNLNTPLARGLTGLPSPNTPLARAEAGLPPRRPGSNRPRRRAPLDPGPIPRKLAASATAGALVTVAAGTIGGLSLFRQGVMVAAVPGAAAWGHLALGSVLCGALLGPIIGTDWADGRPAARRRGLAMAAGVATALGTRAAIHLVMIAWLAACLRTARPAHGPPAAATCGQLQQDWLELAVPLLAASVIYACVAGQAPARPRTTARRHLPFARG